MSEINKTKHSQGWLVWFIPLLLLEFGLLIAYLLKGKNITLFNPKGFIAQEQHSLFVFIVLVLFVIAIPTMFLLYFTAWKYRESNFKAVYDPMVRHGKFFVASIWAIPTVFLVVLTLVMVPATHKLEPRDVIASDKKPITIQVISLRWKWVFLYPEQKIATVNFVQIPEDTPIVFELTADEAPMSSFWIPNLGGQLYSMTSHINRLNLMADEPGDYPGSSAEINGAGFSGMKFTARVSSVGEFNAWAQDVKQSPDSLDAGAYKNLVTPSEDNPIALYATYDSSLYDKVIAKYAGSHDHHSTEHEAHTE